MPWYNDLRPDSDEKKQNYGLLFKNWPESNRKRCIDNLLRLRAGLDNQIVDKKGDDNLIIASWNLKEFGHLNERLPASYFYIAEIINKFDLVAIQEVKSSLDDLRILMRILGSNWAYQVNDITEGNAGNSERFAYIYDKRRVQPSGLSGEIVLWDTLTENSNIKQLKRTPYISGFKSGWKNFAIINLHLQPGEQDHQKAIRREEVNLLMKAIEEKLKKNRLFTDNLMMMGDFNLYKADNDIVQLINDENFLEVSDLADQATNIPGTQIYDRIFYRKNPYFKLAHVQGGKPRGGVFKFYDFVYPLDESSSYHDEMRLHKNDPSNLVDDAAFDSYYRRYWRNNQMSDHYPIWIQLSIDSSDDFLGWMRRQFPEEEV